jgi:hypothetical protein
MDFHPRSSVLSRARSRATYAVIGTLSADGTFDPQSTLSDAESAVFQQAMSSDALAQFGRDMAEILGGIAGGAVAGSAVATALAGSAVAAGIPAAALASAAATLSVSVPAVGLIAGAVIGGIAAVIAIGPSNWSPPPNLDDQGWDTLGSALLHLNDIPERAARFLTPTSTPISPVQLAAVLRGVSVIAGWSVIPVAGVNGLYGAVDDSEAVAASQVWQLNWPSIWNQLANGVDNPAPGSFYAAALKAIGFQRINSSLYANAVARALGAPEWGAPFPAQAPPTLTAPTVSVPPSWWGGPIVTTPVRFPGVGGGIVLAPTPQPAPAPSAPAPAAPGSSTPPATPPPALSTGAKVSLAVVAATAAGGAAQVVGLDVIGWVADALSLTRLVGRRKR